MPLNIGQAVRKRIIDLCESRGLTVNSLSNLCGVTQSTVNNIVSGRNKSATVSTVKKICDGLGMTIQEFFDDEVFYDLEQEIK